MGCPSAGDLVMCATKTLFLTMSSAACDGCGLTGAVGRGLAGSQVDSPGSRGSSRGGGPRCHGGAGEAPAARWRAGRGGLRRAVIRRGAGLRRAGRGTPAFGAGRSGERRSFARSGALRRARRGTPAARGSGERRRAIRAGRDVTLAAGEEPEGEVGRRPVREGGGALHHTSTRCATGD